MPHATEPAIRLRGVVVEFGPTRAIDGLDLDVPQGEIFGFVGANGAGKTTTLRLLLDLLRPTAGEVRVLGVAPRAGGVALRRRIGFLPGDLALFPFLSGRAVLDFFSGLQGRDPVLRSTVLDRLRFPSGALDRACGRYSTGMRQMIGIAAAFQHDPELFVLDEPTTGLDPLVRAAFIELLSERRTAGRTVVFSSHVLGEVRACADRVGLIHEGRLRLVESLVDLTRRLPKRVRAIYRDGRIVESESHDSAPALLRSIQTEGLVDVEVRSGELEDLFRALDREAATP